MKRALAILVALSGTANADERPTIKAPAGWRIDEAQSTEVSKQLDGMSHFGLDPVANAILANADVYVPPAPGVVLSVTLVAAKATAELPAAARAAVDDLHATSQRAALSGSGIVEEGWQEKVDPSAKHIEATLSWRDANAKTSSTARLLVVADDAHILSLTGDCIASDDADPKLVADCKAALATLDPGIDPAKRVAIALAPTGTRPPPPDRPVREPARMTDGTRTPLPPMTIPQEGRTTDRRPVYVGIGLVVLAVVFWWNRHRRARREESE